MLEKAILLNFQSHKETILDFVPGVNVIIGPSDAGKSAIFRGISWPVTNRPLGDAFRSDWGGDTKSILYFSEGNVIERTKGKTKNEYIINGQKLEGFGHNIPETVLNVLQFDSANIRPQMDPPFLLSATPGEAARLLNKAASIDDIDHTITGLKKSYSKIDNDIKHNTKQLVKYQEDMEQYEDLPILEEKIYQVEQLEKSMQGKVEKLKLLQQITRRVRVIEAQLKKTEHIPRLLQKCAEVEKVYLSYQDKSTQHEKYSVVVDRVRTLQDMLSSTEYVDKTLQILRKAEAQFSEWKEKSLQVEESKQLIYRGQRTVMSIDKLQKTIDNLEQDFHRLAPELCPLCGNEMTKPRR